YSFTNPTLHSFPTRRSSDLLAPGGRESRSVLSRPLYVLYGLRRRLPGGRYLTALPDCVGEAIRAQAAHIGAVGPADRMTYIYFRSEEHTSELQSRENLVCRL